tara:strand:+ start:276 stop:653 length:378 start_codon:yes stop_codon:yes gene_type:complete
MKEVYYLFRSNRPEKKFVMVMPTHKHIHHFGSSAHRDFTLMSDKNSKFYEPDKDKREKVRINYINRHKKDPKGVHSASSMSDIILWNKPTLKGGIKEYEKKFNVKVIFSDTKLTDKIKKNLMEKA